MEWGEGEKLKERGKKEQNEQRRKWMKGTRTDVRLCTENMRVYEEDKNLRVYEGV